MLRWLRRLFLALVLLVLLLVGAVYGVSEWMLRRTHAVPRPEIAVADSPVEVAEGARVARMFGCTTCHGAQGEGADVLDDPLLGTIVAPGFAIAAAQNSDADLAAAIRQGVRKDGTAIYVMPSQVYVRLTDRDVAAMIAWMRSFPPSRGTGGETFLGPLGRLLLLSHLLPGGAQPERLAAANRSDEDGAYLVQTSCLQCHALHRPGAMPNSNEVPPPLAPAAALYDDTAFRQLMRTGRGRLSAHLGSMSDIARNNFAVMRDEEIDAIHRYLAQEAQNAP